MDSENTYVHGTNTANGIQTALRGHGRREASRGEGVHFSGKDFVRVIVMVSLRLRSVLTVDR